MGQSLIKLRNVSKDFVLRRTLLGRPTLSLSAVSDLTLDIIEGETLGLVGESGSGKTTVGRLVLRLLEPTSGEISFQGTDISTLSRKDLRELRTKAQIVFQDPFSSFDPRMRVGEILAEGMPRQSAKPASQERTGHLLDLVGLAANYARRFPHQLSGGERQRVGVARALAVDPLFIVLDEPVSALDVSVQAQILNLLRELHNKLNLTLLLISHDLRVVKHLSDRVAVMYLGQLMELAPKTELYDNPQHPYTRALLSAIPPISSAEAQRRQRVVLRGEISSPVNIEAGCRFAPRCDQSGSRCGEVTPNLAEVAEGHFVACFQAQQRALDQVQ